MSRNNFDLIISVKIIQHSDSGSDFHARLTTLTSAAFGQNDACGFFATFGFRQSKKSKGRIVGGERKDTKCKWR